MFVVTSVQHMRAHTHSRALILRNCFVVRMRSRVITARRTPTDGSQCLLERIHDFSLQSRN